MVRRHLRSGSKVVSSLLSTRGLLQGAMSVSDLSNTQELKLMDQASGTVKKVIEINPYLLGTMAGGAADCQYW